MGRINLLKLERIGEVSLSSIPESVIFVNNITQNPKRKKPL